MQTAQQQESFPFPFPLSVFPFFSFFSYFPCFSVFSLPVVGFFPSSFFFNKPSHSATAREEASLPFKSGV